LIHAEKSKRRSIYISGKSVRFKPSQSISFQKRLITVKLKFFDTPIAPGYAMIQKSVLGLKNRHGYYTHFINHGRAI
jgi:hypothetical protein